MNGEKKEIPKGTLGLVELYCLSIGQVIGAGVITLVGPAITATGYSAWLAYLLAIVLGFFTVFPLVFICGTLRLGGGYYSLIGALTNKTLAGMYAFAQLTKLLSISLFAVSLGVYVQSLFPQVNTTVCGVAFLTFFYVVNLCGIDMMAKIQKYMTWVLIAALLMFIVFGLMYYNHPVFDITHQNFLTNGIAGLWTASFLFVYSTTGYSMTMNYGSVARNPQRDIPWALILSVPTLVILYCGVAAAGSCVLPMEEVMDQPLTLVARVALPKVLFIAFIIGGPIMALLTTMNSTMPANCLPIMVSCKDGWLPKSFGKENKRGVAWKIMTLNYLLGLVPLLLGFNVKTITNNIMLLNSCMYLMCYYAYFQMPKKYPDAWKRSRWHVADRVYYLVCAVGLVGQCAILVNSAFALTPIIAIVSIAAIAICCVLGLLRARSPEVTVSTTIWED